MTPQIADALMWAGVTPPKPGSNRTICPKCSHARSERNRRKPCLNVFDRGDYVEFICYNCPWVHKERVA
jgi:hypothetical protein